VEANFFGLLNCDNCILKISRKRMGWNAHIILYSSTIFQIHLLLFINKYRKIEIHQSQSWKSSDNTFLEPQTIFNFFLSILFLCNWNGNPIENNDPQSICYMNFLLAHISKTKTYVWGTTRLPLYICLYFKLSSVSNSTD